MISHPEYGLKAPDWILMRDAYEGERKIKKKGVTYLPYTEGQELDGAGTPNTVGENNYQAYKMRARFPNFVREAVQTAVGMLHAHPPKIELPPQLEDVQSSLGEDIPQLMRRINEQQLLTGRVALLADVNSSDEFYISAYETENLRDWDTFGLPSKYNFVLLDESGYVRNRSTLAWEKVEKYLLLQLISRTDDGPVYQSARIVGQDFAGAPYSDVAYKGRTLDRIPFVIINSCDLDPTVDEPPLLDLGNLCLTIYRGEADYRHNLHMRGQDTLVIAGGAGDDLKKVRSGAGAVIHLPQDSKAQYIGTNAEGLSEQREALAQDRIRAGSMGAQSFDTVTRERESGKSLNTRIAARTADMKTIALSGAKGLEKVLKDCATWVGADPNDVNIYPNLEFGEAMPDGQALVELTNALNLGLPLSAQSVHALLFKLNLTRKTYEQELKEAEEEKNTAFGRAENGDRNPDQSRGVSPQDPSPGNGAS